MKMIVCPFCSGFKNIRRVSTKGDLTDVNSKTYENDILFCLNCNITFRKNLIAQGGQNEN